MIAAGLLAKKSARERAEDKYKES
jgi:hypothetical protein